MTTFKKDDKVVWHHTFATQHASGSIVRESAIPVLDKDHPEFGDPGTGQIGTIVDKANDAGTWWEVKFDDDNTKILTNDELVKVAEGE